MRFSIHGQFPIQKYGLDSRRNVIIDLLRHIFLELCLLYSPVKRFQLVAMHRSLQVETQSQELNDGAMRPRSNRYTLQDRANHGQASVIE